MTISNNWRKLVRRTGLLAVLICALVISVAACGGGGGTGGAATAPPLASEPTATTPASDPSGGSAQEVQVTLKEWAIEPKTIEVQSGRVRFNVTNTGQFTHNFVVLRDGSEVGRTPNFAQSDGQKVLEVDLQPGTYRVVCDIQGHAERGMQGELIVK
jgi:plastocyanin